MFLSPLIRVVHARAVTTSEFGERNMAISARPAVDRQPKLCANYRQSFDDDRKAAVDRAADQGSRRSGRHTSYARVQGAVGALQSAAVALPTQAFNPIAATVTGTV